MPPLLRHEWAVLRGEATLAFSTVRDWLMLAACVAIALVVIANASGIERLADLRFAAATGAIVGFSAIRATRARWHTLISETIAAPSALSVRERAIHAAAMVALIWAVLLPIAWWRLGILPAVTIAGGTALGALLAMLLPRGLPAFLAERAGRSAAIAQTPGSAIATAQLPLYRWSRLAAVAALIVAPPLVALALRVRPDMPDIAVAGGAAVTAAGAALLLGRVDYATVRFLAMSGHGALASAALHLRLPFEVALPGLALAAAIVPSAFPIGAALVAGVFLWVAARVWLYRRRSQRHADIVLTFATIGLLALAIAFPFALPPVALAGAAFAYAGARDMNWWMR